MKYICVKTNTWQSMKNYKYISKLRLQVEFCSDFFGGEWYWYTSTKSRTIYKF